MQPDGQTYLADLDEQSPDDDKERFIQAELEAEVAKAAEALLEVDPEVAKLKDELAQLGTDVFDQRMQAINAQIKIEQERRRRPKKGPANTGKALSKRNPRKAKKLQAKKARKANR